MHFKKNICALAIFFLRFKILSISIQFLWITDVPVRLDTSSCLIFIFGTQTVFLVSERAQMFFLLEMSSSSISDSVYQF